MKGEDQKQRRWAWSAAKGKSGAQSLGLQCDKAVTRTKT